MSTKCLFCGVYEPSVEEDEDCHDYDNDFVDDYDFADPGGNSALRAENVITRYSSRGVEQLFCRTHGCHTRVYARFNHCPGCAAALNIRKFKCPTCGAKDTLTQEDLNRHYQCDRCADRIEGRYGWADY